MKRKRRMKYFFDNVLPTAFYPFFFKRTITIFFNLPAPGRYVTRTDIFEFELDPSLLYGIYVQDSATSSGWTYSFRCGEIPSPDIYVHWVTLYDAEMASDKIDKFYSTSNGASNSTHTYQTNFDIFDITKNEFIPKEETVITKLMLVGKPYYYSSGLHRGNPKYYDGGLK